MTKARDIADGVDTADIADGAISTAKLADNSINATKLDVSGNGTAGQFLSSDGDGTMTWADAGGGFDLGTALTGTTPTIDWSSATAFSHTLSGNTTYSFSNVPSGGEIELFLKNVGKSYDVLSINGIETLSDVSFSAQVPLASQYTNLMFNPDGSKLYLSGSNGTYPIYQYSLSTNYDINTATYDSVSNAGGSVGAWAFGSRAFNGDGTKMIAGYGTDLTDYTLSTAYDITTLSTTANNTINTTSLFRTRNGISNPEITQIRWFNDGYGLFLGSERIESSSVGYNTPTAITISLSTAYDISSTLTFESQLFHPDNDGISLREWDDTAFIDDEVRVDMSADGSTVILMASVPHNGYFTVVKYHLTTPYNLDTAVLSGKSRWDGQSNSQLYKTQFSPDGKWVYFTGKSTGTGSNVWKRFDIQGDYSIDFPSNTTPLSLGVGDGPDPSTTTYLRMVSLDGTNVLITDHKEIV